MKVMGISPVQRLVAPRVVAALVVALLLTVVVAMTAMVTAFAMNVGGGTISSGTYLDSFVVVQPADRPVARRVQGGGVRLHRHDRRRPQGAHRQGGPKGVADAVNQAVVLSVILLAVVNVGLTQAYVMLVPQGIA